MISSESTIKTTVKDPVKVEDTPDEFEIPKPKDTTDPNYATFIDELYKKDKTKVPGAKRSVREAPVAKDAIKVEDTPDEFEIPKPNKVQNPKYDDFINNLYKGDKTKETAVKTKRSADPPKELLGQFDFPKPLKSEANDDEFFSTLYKNDKLLSSTAARVPRKADFSPESYSEDAIFKRLTRSKRMVVFRPLFV